MNDLTREPVLEISPKYAVFKTICFTLRRASRWAKQHTPLL